MEDVSVLSPLKQLVSLNVSRNAITSDAFNALEAPRNLNVLDVGFNKLTHMAFEAYRYLKRLNLECTLKTR